MKERSLSDKLKKQLEALPKQVNITFVRRPEVLLQPNLVKPLHGVNPRTILGRKWWDKTRKEAYASTGFCCLACGIHKDLAKGRAWLEAHESYETNYQTGRVVYIEALPLCHFCHNYIHSGRLRMLLQKGEIHHAKYVSIIQHGDQVLFEAGLSKVSQQQQEEALVKLERQGKVAAWSSWRLVIDGKEYEPLYKSYAEWEQSFNPKLEE